MKLVRFRINDTVSCGIVTLNGIIDFQKTAVPFKDLHALIEAGPDGLELIKTLCNNIDPHYATSDVELLAPLPKPSKFLAIGMNYKKHEAEADKLGVEKRQHQTWFNKQISCINDPYGDIDPGVTEKLDYEVELGLVIGKKSKYLTKENAASAIFGYLIINDVSARDWQFHTPTFTMGKSFDTHGPIGPWIVTADEIKNPNDLELKCYVNNELRQHNSTAEMIHSIEDQLVYLSAAFTLEPGDLIATGTPEGVGVAMTPPTYLQPGDIVKCEVESIGHIESTVVLKKRD